MQSYFVVLENTPFFHSCACALSKKHKEIGYKTCLGD